MSDEYYLDFVEDTTVSFPSDLVRSSFVSIFISEGYEIIPDYCFSGFSRVTNITLPSTIISIGNDAFITTNIKSLFLPKNVKIIHEGNPFDITYSLEKFEVDSLNPYFTVLDGVLYSKDMKKLNHFPPSLNISKFSVPSTVESIGWAAMKALLYVKTIFLSEAIQSMTSYSFVDAPLLELLVINRRFKQKPVVFGSECFYNTQIKQNDIIYIYPILPPPTCIIRHYSLYQNIFLYVFILLE